MGKFLGRLFGSEKALDGLVTGAVKGLDALVYTEEERATAAADERAKAREMVLVWMQSTQGQNLGRRLLALIITAVWLLQYVTAMSVSVIAVWMVDPVPWQESAQIVGGYAERMNGAMMLILGFYFAAPHMGPIVETALSKFGGKGDVKRRSSS